MATLMHNFNDFVNKWLKKAKKEEKSRLFIALFVFKSKEDVGRGSKAWAEDSRDHGRS